MSYEDTANKTRDSGVIRLSTATKTQLRVGDFPWRRGNAYVFAFGLAAGMMALALVGFLTIFTGLFSFGVGGCFLVLVDRNTRVNRKGEACEDDDSDECFSHGVFLNQACGYQTSVKRGRSFF